MIEEIYQKFLSCSGVSTDSRNISRDVMFFALKGPNFNGNLYATKALDDGAKFAVVDEEVYSLDKGQYILVKDVLTTLQELANFHRKKFNIPFIGITGSNGKTTTKELMYAVLSTQFNTLATRGNLNNHIGVPLTLLELKQGHEMAIIEMGANKLGDIQELCEIADPDHGLITNIGMAHTEGFGGFEGVIRGKSELYNHLIRKKGVIFVNTQQDILMNMSKRMINPVFYPDGDEFVSASPFVEYKSTSGERVITQISGSYNYENISAALKIGSYFGVEEYQANKAIASYLPANNRSQVVKKGTNIIILDAYNANPSSMTAAIENLKIFDQENKGVILGDMYELGIESDQMHADLGNQLKDLNFNPVIFCGKHMKHAAKTYPKALYFEEKEKLIEYLKTNPIKNTALLIKASRGMGLESLIEVLV